MVFDLLRERAEVQQRGVKIPEAQSVRKFIDSGIPLGNPGLKQLIEETGDPELKQALDWSAGVNKSIEEMVEGVPPFPSVPRCLEKVADKADCLVVSATPGEALRREWAEHGIDKYVAIIAGQEMGTKKEHIALAANGKYDADKILMIGDAIGDYKAAEANHALFYPIIPSREEESWQLFHEEACDKFLEGKYAGSYANKLMKEFEKYLPQTPPWKK